MKRLITLVATIALSAGVQAGLINTTIQPVTDLKHYAGNLTVYTKWDVFAECSKGKLFKRPADTKKLESFFGDKAQVSINQRGDAVTIKYAEMHLMGNALDAASQCTYNEQALEQEIVTYLHSRASKQQEKYAANKAASDKASKERTTRLQAQLSKDNSKYEISLNAPYSTVEALAMMYSHTKAISTNQCKAYSTPNANQLVKLTSNMKEVSLKSTVFQADRWKQAESVANSLYDQLPKMSKAECQEAETTLMLEYYEAIRFVAASGLIIK